MWLWDFTASVAWPVGSLRAQTPKGFKTMSQAAPTIKMPLSRPQGTLKAHKALKAHTSTPPPAPEKAGASHFRGL
jgi:hypothetical protein